MHFFQRLRFGACVCAVTLATAARADVVLAWNQILADFFSAPGAGLPPHAQARAWAMTHLAIEQAIVATSGKSRPVGAPTDEQQAAAATAASDVLDRILPGRFNANAAALLRELKLEPDEKARALAAGHAAASLVLQKRDGDKWIETDPRVGAIQALGTPLQSAADPNYRGPRSPWLAATPFVLRKADHFEVTAPYWTDFEGRMHPNAWLERAKMFDSVDPAATGTLAQFWSESPIVAWNRIARLLVERAGLDLAGRARVLAAVNVAMADATLSSLHWRFMYNAWHARWTENWMPVVGDRSPTDVTAQIDGGYETISVRSETVKILTPPVRNFPSVAATVAGAASAALAKVIEAKQPGFTLAFRSADGDAGLPGRGFADLAAAGRECAFASSLDGKHSREACVAGYRLGESIGNYVAKQTRTPRR